MLSDAALNFFDRYVKGRGKSLDALKATPGIEAAT
jgi:hypothetical protein